MGGNLLPRKALMETLHLESQHVLKSQWRKRCQASMPATVITTKPCMGAWQLRDESRLGRGWLGQRQPEVVSLLGFSGGDRATEQVERGKGIQSCGLLAFLKLTHSLW